MKKLYAVFMLLLAVTAINPVNYAWPKEQIEAKSQEVKAKLEKPKKTGPPAPEFDLIDVQGTKVRSEQLKGKITVIAFWATWCYWCRREIPNLNKLYSLYKDKGLEIVGISLDQRGIMDVGPFLKATPINYKVLIGSQEMALKLGIFGLPRIMIVDKDWTIYHDYPGYVEFEMLEKDVLALSEAGK